MKKNNKNIYIIILMVVFISISIGYALLSTTFNINGKSTISKNTWALYFDNVVVKNGSVEAIKMPTIVDATTVDFEVSLNLPGDYYEFTVDVVNNGTIDAMIDSVIKTPNLTATQAKYLNYDITYENNEEIGNKQLVRYGEFVRLKVKVEYKEDIVAADLPTSSESLNLGFIVNYVQADGTGIDVSNSGVSSVVSSNGRVKDIGTIVTIGTEKFYTIGIEDNNLKLLSMYNLHVGKEVTAFDYDLFEATSNWIANPTGMQSSTALGCVWDVNTYEEKYPFVGVTAFSNTSTDYSGSIVEGYVNNYKNLLENKFDVEIANARLITMDELYSDEIGCSSDPETCLGAPEWVYSTTYWINTVPYDGYVMVLYFDGEFSYDLYDRDCFYGVRPVIYLSLDYFEGEVFSFKIIRNNKNEILYDFEYGMTWQEWIDSDYNTYGFYYEDDGVYSSGSIPIFGEGSDVNPNDKITFINYKWNDPV